MGGPGPRANPVRERPRPRTQPRPRGQKQRRTRGLGQPSFARRFFFLQTFCSFSAFSGCVISCVTLAAPLLSGFTVVGRQLLLFLNCLAIGCPGEQPPLPSLRTPSEGKDRPASATCGPSHCPLLPAADKGRPSLRGRGSERSILESLTFLEFKEKSVQSL